VTTHDESFPRNPARRRLFQAAGAAGVATVLPLGSTVAQQRAAPAQAYVFFNPAEAAFIEAAVARLIPRDETGPGALEAGVPNYIDKQLESLAADAWMKEVAPSTQLRKWFGHQPERWDEFRRRYRAELNANPGAWKPILEAATPGTVTLLYSAHDTVHNGAVVLREYLVDRAKRGLRPSV